MALPINIEEQKIIHYKFSIYLYIPTLSLDSPIYFLVNEAVSLLFLWSKHFVSIVETLCIAYQNRVTLY